MNFSRSKFRVLFCIFLLIFSLSSTAEINADLFKNLKARNIGPSTMSGRITAVDAVVSDPNIIYVGTATGGVWRSVNGGTTWKPIFDDRSTSSIGDVRIFQPNPRIVWVGTGEANPRNSAGVGRGLFKTLDGGKSWQFLGLAETERISRVLVHPEDPDIVYVAALGTTWGENSQRGVFKTTDGGKSWRKILYVDARTGAADLALEPGNPNKLLAAMWEHRRWPWFFKSGGPGSGLFMTIDGGEKWEKIDSSKGMPGGELGRIGIAFAPNNPQIVYALVEAQKSGFYRSGDGGYSWRLVNDQAGINDRPFYYSDIRVNPRNENIVYSLQSRLRMSEDGGKNFKNLTQYSQSHPDYHAMWLHPDGEHFIIGNDGGVVISRDRGKTWRFVGNLPVGQFYHISFDMSVPYNVYGGMQDNGSWMGPSRVLTHWSILDYHWRNIGFGDGFDTEPDPQKEFCGYGMWQGGRILYFNGITGLFKDIRPPETEVRQRYNWNAGFAVDPFEPATIYLGSQFVHRSKNKGHSWEVISPDLTTNDPAKQKQDESGGLTRDVSNAENHTTILCIAPSPVKKGIIWVGTDDGHVQVTRDGGGTWTKVSDPLTGTTGRKGKVPYGTWIPHVEASRFNEEEAFVVFDDHRRANWKPYVFVTRDFGRTWKSLATPRIDGFAHVIRQDVVNPRLLFLGTEFGLFLSFDGGKEWMKWRAGFPTVPVRDLAVHPRDHDLIIGTHGRSVYILDDISPLRDINEEFLQKEVHLFKIKDTIQFRPGIVLTYSNPGDTSFKGTNRPPGAAITYYLNLPGKGGEKNKPDKKKKITIDILDQEGTVVKKLEGKSENGLQRLYWDLTRTGFRYPSNSPQGSGTGWEVLVMPGLYTARLSYGDIQLQESFRVEKDPRLDIQAGVLEENYRISVKLGNMMESSEDGLQRIKQTRQAIRTILDYSGETEYAGEKELTESAERLDKLLKGLERQIIQDRNEQGIFRHEKVLNRQIFNAVCLVNSEGNAVEPMTQAAMQKVESLIKHWDELSAEITRVYDTEVKKFREQVEKSGFSLFNVPAKKKGKNNI